MDQLGELDPGTRLETVLLGGLYDGRVRVWRDNEGAEYREVGDPEAVTSVLGRGMLARTGTEPNRFREVALLDAQNDLLVLLGRPTRDTTGEHARAEGRTVRAPLSDVAQPTAKDWTPWGRWLGEVVGLAAGRSEYVVIETGGWDVVNEPYVLVGVFPDSDGGWISVIEALPAPADPPWTASVGHVEGSTVSAPATKDNVDAAGLIAIKALATWALSPLDVVLTFGRREPSNPWRPDT